nr:MAG TPA: hypothetical protein [Caudoviricetes sp.]DAS54348.1 MAG TPA: hypothetical protein [Caudoviricetes sp.]DAW66763.1 MAG TPA: hypothetical protein [Caudoviricetes sp.]
MLDCSFLILLCSKKSSISLILQNFFVAITEKSHYLNSESIHKKKAIFNSESIAFFSLKSSLSANF